MTAVAVVAHRKKTIGGGLSELRRLLSDRGVDRPVWHEVDKSRHAPASVRSVIEQDVDLLLLWGGDGTIQRSLDAVVASSGTAASRPVIGIIPAGTANLLAGNLGIPTHLERAVDIAFDGQRRPLDLGVVNGEHFAVMAGTGLDAMMMRDADSGLKDRVGRLAYVWTGLRAARTRPAKMSVQIGGATWFEGRAGCLLLGNMGCLTGGLVAFPDARYDDGQLEVGVVTAGTTTEWAKVMGRLLTGTAERSKLLHTARGRDIRVKIDREQAYELDGGARGKADKLNVHVVAGAVTVSVPRQPQSE